MTRLHSVARKRHRPQDGLRGLRSILEGILLETMFELPTFQGVEEVVINGEVIEGRAQPLMIYSERRSDKQPPAARVRPNPGFRPRAISVLGPTVAGR